MALYALTPGSLTGMQQDAQDHVFNTCMSTMGNMLGITDIINNNNGIDNTNPIRLLLAVSCANITRLAASLYDNALPFDVDRIFPEKLAVPLYGLVSPVLIALGIVLNCCLVVLLLCPRALCSARWISGGTATGVLLGGIAALDALTGSLQLPFLLYAYALGGHKDYTPMVWCHVYWYVSKLLPTVTHTASLWLTAMLQRYLGVSPSDTNRSCISGCRHRMKKVLCSKKDAGALTVTCTICAGVLHSLPAAFFSFQSVRVVSKSVFDSSELDIIDTCSLRLRDPSLDVVHDYVYTWLRLLLAEILPCFLIGLFNVRLVRVTRSSARYRRSLVHGHRESVKQEYRGARRTTVMLIAVTTTALLVEVVIVVILLIEFLHVATERSLIHQDLVNHLDVVSNFLITATLPVNFFIYSYKGSHVTRLLKVTTGLCTNSACCCAGRRQGKCSSTGSRGNKRHTGSGEGNSVHARREGQDAGGNVARKDAGVKDGGESGEHGKEGKEAGSWRGRRRRPSVFVVESLRMSDDPERRSWEDNCSKNTDELSVTVQ